MKLKLYVVEYTVRAPLAVRAGASKEEVSEAAMEAIEGEMREHDGVFPPKYSVSDMSAADAREFGQCLPWGDGGGNETVGKIWERSK